ncbi:MAG TPA: hypothetical protein VHC49_01390 [Mycobacteriales bacterium]|nr:hypothetical protein [Mycobacteriales bacterium]
MKRAQIALGGTVAATLLIAGCSHDSGTTESSAGNIVLASYSTTTKAQSARITETSTTEFPGAKHPLTQSLSGVVDFTTKTGELTSKLGPMVSTTRFVGGTAYQKLPGDLAQIYGAHTPWITYRLDSVVGSSSQQQNAASSPLQALAALQGATDKTEKVGTETVDGTRTTHYRATIDLKRAVDKAGAFKDVMKAMLEDAKSTKVPCDLWLDEQGRVRKQSTTTTMQVKDLDGKPATIHSTETLMLTDFGTKVDVQAPPKDQVTDVTAKMKELRKN